MSTREFSPGLAGVVAFETEIAEPDREGGSLRYRGIDIEQLVGQVPFEKVWGLLVDESLEPGLPASYCELPVRTGGYMSDLQAGLATLGPKFGLEQLVDMTPEQARDDLARLSCRSATRCSASCPRSFRPQGSRASSSRSSRRTATGTRTRR